MPRWWSTVVAAAKVGGAIFWGLPAGRVQAQGSTVEGPESETAKSDPPNHEGG
jgi:hypothetical protein